MIELILMALQLQMTMNRENQMFTSISNVL
jgi:hypothetical protein